MAPTKPNCKPARHVSNVFDLDNLRACLSDLKFESQSGEFRGDGRNFEAAQEKNDSLATSSVQYSDLPQLLAPTFPANPSRTLTLVLRPALTATTTPDNRSEKIQRRKFSTCDLAKFALGTCWCSSCKKKRAGTTKKVQSVVGEKSKIMKRSKLTTISKKSEGQKRREKKRRERRRAEKAEKLSTDTLMLTST